MDEIKDTGINLEDFRKTSFDLACDFYKSKEWNESALHFLICIKCSSPDYLSLSTEGENLTHRFARTIAHLYNENKIDESHLNLVEQAISQRKEIKIHVSRSKKKTYLDTKTLNEFIDQTNIDPSKRSFQYDQGSCLYLLKGLIMERLDSADTKGILQAYELASRLAPRHPWGASGYLAEDKDISIKDIKSYREYAIQFGAKDAIPMLVEDF